MGIVPTRRKYPGCLAQHYDADGAMLGTEFRINTETFDDQSSPQIAAMADGGFVVVRKSNLQDSGSYGIYGQRYDANGDTVGAETLINTVSDRGHFWPTIAALADGGFVVSWPTFIGVGANSLDIYVRQFEARLFGTSDADIIEDDIGANWINGQGGPDTIFGNAGGDAIFGQNGADILFGGNGADLLEGGAGADTLYGGVGADELIGGLRDDILKGGNGSDILIGGEGKDKLFGGNNVDVFVYNNTSDSLDDNTADVIKDYEVGIDQIDLSGIAAGLSFIGTAGFSGAGAEVRILETATGKTNVRIDVDGDGIADMKITLLNTAGVTDVDFIL